MAIHKNFGHGKCLNGNKPNDKVYTPEDIAKDIISRFNLSGKVLDPFYGKGVFYNNFPDNVEKDYCEIDLGKDFFDYNEHVDWIISNPPYSIYTDVMTHSYEIADNIVYLIPLNKIVSSWGRVKELAAYGGVPYIYILPAGKCGFPFGFPACAVYMQKGYTGDTHIEIMQEEDKKDMEVIDL